MAILSKNRGRFLNHSNPSQHQRTDGVIHHRFVGDGQQLLLKNDFYSLIN